MVYTYTAVHFKIHTDHWRSMPFSALAHVLSRASITWTSVYYGIIVLWCIIETQDSDISGFSDVVLPP